MPEFDRKPCPKCGVKGYIHRGERWSIRCRKCLLIGPQCHTVDEAIEGWNQLKKTVDTK